MQSIPRLSREERSALIQQSRMKEIAAIAAIQQSLDTQLTSAIFFAISLREQLQKSGQNFQLKKLEFLVLNIGYTFEQNQ